MLPCDFKYCDCFVFYVALEGAAGESSFRVVGGGWREVGGIFTGQAVCVINGTSASFLVCCLFFGGRLTTTEYLCLYFVVFTRGLNYGPGIEGLGTFTLWVFRGTYVNKRVRNRLMEAGHLLVGARLFVEYWFTMFAITWGYIAC